MMTLSITLSDDDERKLQKASRLAGMSIEEGALHAIKTFSADESVIEPEDEEFLRMAEKVMEENAELYRRLAKGPGDSSP